VYLREFGAYDKGADGCPRCVTPAASPARRKQRGWTGVIGSSTAIFILYDVGRDAWVEPILRADPRAGRQTVTRRPVVQL